MKPLLDENVAAQMLGTKAKTMANWRYQGVGPKFIKIGRLVKYDPDDLQAYREARRIGSTSACSRGCNLPCRFARMAGRSAAGLIAC